MISWFTLTFRGAVLPGLPSLRSNLDSTILSPASITNAPWNQGGVSMSACCIYRTLPSVSRISTSGR